VRPPSITVVGPVAALGEELAWLGSGPLAGQVIVVTRARAQASGMAARLRDLGARVVEAPSIRTEPLDAQLPDLDDVDLLVVTSPIGVRRLFEVLRAGGRDARALAGTKIAVVGPGTAETLRGFGIEPDVVPVRAVAEALAEALVPLDVRRALVVRGEQARRVVPDALAARGVAVEQATLYRTVPEILDDATRRRVLEADWATFTSGSSANAFVTAIGGPESIRESGLRIASIGPITTAALRRLGLEPDLEASEHTPAGLVDALVVALGGPGR
jgi:uroporphyrinogen III methyltransferase/synthase